MVAALIKPNIKFVTFNAEYGANIISVTLDDLRKQYKFDTGSLAGVEELINDYDWLQYAQLIYLDDVVMTVQDGMDAARHILEYRP